VTGAGGPSTAGGSLARTHADRPGLPRGRSGLPADEVGSAHRDRLIRAMIAASAELGYADVGVAEVVRRARVSRNAFYAHFADKEECFLAAVDFGAQTVFQRIATADGFSGGISAYLRFLADEPEFARVFLVEMHAAGPRARERFAAAHARFAELTRRWHDQLRADDPTWPAVPEEVFTALVGAIHELIATRVRAGGDPATLEDTAVRVYRALVRGWS
jgi:AcrR family transcriptional regulator